MLTLTDLPASREQKRLALFFALLLAGVSLTTLFHARLPLSDAPNFLPAYGMALCFSDLVTAYLLLIQYRQNNTLPLAILASAYFYSGLIVIPQILTFPGVFSATGLFGAGPQTAVWLWVLWHGGFPLLLLAYVLADLNQGDRRTGRSQRTTQNALLGSVMLLVTALTWFVTRDSARLPVIVAKGNYWRLITSGAGPAVWLLNAGALAALAWRFRARSTLHLWLLLATEASLFDVTLTLFSSHRYGLGWYVARIDSLLSGFFLLAMLLHEINRLYAGLSAANRTLSKLAHADGLSGLANRRSFDERLQQEWQQGARTSAPLSLLMIDIDHFKAYNDSCGHLAGDDCIRRVSAAIQQTLTRSTDFAARYGGEEFCVLLPATSSRGAEKVARLMLMQVTALQLPHPSLPAPGCVTVSIGAATLTPTAGSEPDVLVAAADKALYAAKNQGRRRVCIARQPVQTAWHT